MEHRRGLDTEVETAVMCECDARVLGNPCELVHTRNTGWNAVDDSHVDGIFLDEVKKVPRKVRVVIGGDGLS